MSQCERIGHIWNGLTCKQCGKARTFQEWRTDFKERLNLASITRTSLTLSGDDAALLEQTLSPDFREWSR